MPILAELANLKTATGEGAAIFVMGSDATGDVTHVYAAFKAGKVKGLAIFEWTASLAAMKGKFEALNMPANLIKTVNLAVDRPTKAQLENAVDKPNRKQKDSIDSAVAKVNLVSRNDHRDCLTAICRALKFSVQPLHESTAFALEGLQDATKRKSLHVDLRGVKGLVESDEPLTRFWQDRITAFDQDVVVLWGRRSGKAKTTVGNNANLGPHLYGDSSTTGLVQIGEKCKVFSRVVVTGDVAAIKKDRFTGCLYIGEFWNDLKKAPYSIADVTQRIQIRTFYVLKQLLKASEKRLVHVGMRSGNLDNYAFAGQTVVYLVPLGFDDQRIVQLAIKDVAQPPTTAGKSSDTKPGGANRWIQSRPPESPRVAYRQGLGPLPPDLDNVIDRTDLRFVDQNRQRFRMLNTSLKEGTSPDSYPIDTATQLNANILYRAVKDAVKDNKDIDPGEVLRTYMAQKKGFSEEYLLKLITQIKTALTKKVI